VKPSATIRTRLDDFVVDELPAYVPAGSGGHAFLHVRKRGLTTLECVARIARALGVPSRDIGFAGMKDRHAVATQYLSVPWPESTDLTPLRELRIDDIDVLDVQRHGNKLRTGHLVGNRFRIVLRDIDRDRVSAVVQEIGDLAVRGVPNAFGPQRFGRDGSNPGRAIAWIRGTGRGPRDPRMARLLFSSVQSWMFDRVLQARVEQGTWATALTGDVMKKHDTGGLFDCTDETVDAARAGRGEVSPTGPIFGADMRRPSGKPDDLEQAVLRDAVGDPSVLDRFRKIGAGSRRTLRVFPRETAAAANADGTVTVEFTLPKGVYATTVLGMVVELADATARHRETQEAPETSVHDEMLYDSPPGSG